MCCPTRHMKVLPFECYLRRFEPRLNIMLKQKCKQRSSKTALLKYSILSRQIIKRSFCNILELIFQSFEMPPKNKPQFQPCHNTQVYLQSQISKVRFSLFQIGTESQLKSKSSEKSLNNLRVYSRNVGNFLVRYDSRVVMQAIFQSGTTLES